MRMTAAILLSAVVLLTGCGHFDHKTVPAPSTQPGSTGAPAVSALSVPPGGWLGSPVGSVHVLVSRYGGRASWSPEGMIAYSMLDHVVNGTRYADIYVMNGNGTGQRCITCDNPLVPHLSNDVPVWDPNGRLIVFEGQNPSLGPISPHLSQGGAGFNNDLWAITPNGRHAWKLTSTRRGEAVLHPQFSPNGKELVWAAYDHLSGLRGLLHRGQWDIHTAVFSVNSAGMPTLADQHVYRPGPATPAAFYETHVVTGGGTIVFSSNMDSPYQYSCRGCALGIWEWNPQSSAPATLLTPDTSTWNEHAALSPSGRHIAWISSRGEQFTPSSQWGKTLRTDWWLMSPNGSHAVRATYFNTPDTPNLRVICAEGSWNPTGTAIVATVDVIQGSAANTEIIVISFRAPQ